MSEEREPPILKGHDPNARLEGNKLLKAAKDLSRYMREQLEELQEMLGKPITGETDGGKITFSDGTEKELGPGRVEFRPIDPPSLTFFGFDETESDSLIDFGRPLIFQAYPVDRKAVVIPFDPSAIDDGPNGRDDPLAYRSPLFDSDEELGDVIVVDALDSIVVARMAAAPTDQLDREREIEAHARACATCGAQYLKTCDYCLELKLCERVPTSEELHVERYIVNDAGLVVPGQPARIVKAVELCRTCRNDQTNGCGLVLGP